MVQNPDGRPLNELLDLLQSEVMPAPVLLGAEAEREAIEATNPVSGRNLQGTSEQGSKPALASSPKGRPTIASHSCAHTSCSEADADRKHLIVGRYGNMGLIAGLIVFTLTVVSDTEISPAIRLISICTPFKLSEFVPALLTSAAIP